MDRRKHMNTPPCIAYARDGRLCGKPALYLDRKRGGYVCWAHRPLLPDERPGADPPPGQGGGGAAVERQGRLW